MSRVFAPHLKDRSADQHRLVLWHGVCALGVILLVVASQVLHRFDGRPELSVQAALVVMIIPGLLGLWLRVSDRRRDRVLVLGGWCVAAISASALSGGLTGSLAGILILPVAAGLILGGRHWAMNGALAGLITVALSALAGLASVRLGGPAPLAAGLATLCGLAGVAATAAALIWTWGPRERALALTETSHRQTEALLATQPGLTLILTPTGRVLTTYGLAPPALAIAELMQNGLIASVHAPDRPHVISMLDRATRAPISEADVAAEVAAEVASGVQISFTPRQALDRRVMMYVRRMDGVGHATRLVAQAFDGTAQFAREHGLETARAEAVSRNEGKSRFLANMSHELRTPLNAVLGFSDIMKSRLFGPLPDRYAEYADSIHQAGEHLLALINDVLDVSKIEAERYELSIERIDAREAISAAIALVRLSATDKAVSLSGVLPTETVTVDADPRALQQITLNLLSNAIKFTPVGGTVTATLEAVGPYLELVVADTGVGIASEDLKRLGRPFEQAGGVEQRAQGTGLGLSLVRSLAELHGGRMTVESTLGEGTAVTVRLPVVTIQTPLPLEIGLVEPRTVEAEALETGAEIIALRTSSDAGGSA